MVSFRKLTMMQLGGEERLLKMDNVEVNFDQSYVCMYVCISMVKVLY